MPPTRFLLVAKPPTLNDPAGLGMEPIVYCSLPFAIACIGLWVWKAAYAGQRPLSRGTKLIVVGIIVWSLLPLLVVLAICYIAFMGGHYGD